MRTFAGYPSPLRITTSGASIALGVVGCPACWPMYVGLLSSAGLGVLTDATVVRPVTIVLLAFALGGLAYRPDPGRGLRPFGLGAAGAAIVLYGRFAVASDPVVLVGAGLLLAASLWNGWPLARRGCAECGAAKKASTIAKET